MECEVALAPNVSKGLTSSCRDYTSQNNNVDAGSQDLDGERSHPAVCRFLKPFHAHHTSSSYARGQRRSRLNQMLNTNPRMRANQEQFSFYFDRVVKVEIIVLRACRRRRGAKSKEFNERSLISCLFCKRSFKILKMPQNSGQSEVSALLHSSVCFPNANLNPKPLPRSVRQHSTTEMPSLFPVLYQLWHFLSTADCRLWLEILR